MNKINALLVEDTVDFNLEKYLKEADCAYFKIRQEDNILALLKELSPQIIIFNVNTLTESVLTEFQQLSTYKALPSLIFAKAASAQVIDLAIDAGISELIINDTQPVSINSLINIALSRFKYQQDLKIALEDALEKLENRKLTDRAKAILIKTQNFSEDEAYHTLRKLAMNRKITLGEMAKNVIAMSELFK